MNKRWIYRDEPDEKIVDELSMSLNINAYLSKILIQRGISDFETARSFFCPSLDKLYDPFLMKNMDRAVNRLCDAIFNKEKILLYGDYDVDGTTAVSLMYLFLKQFSDHIDFYIPDRDTEGYGISEKGIRWTLDHQFSLVIALDCGIRANDRATQAQQAGIDLIICDHHLPGDALPEAFAILDPKQEHCDYPFKELSGCGVGFKLLEAFCQQNTIKRERLFEFLDILAVSIASDIVPIVDENRILAFHGLKKLNHNPSAGLKSLIKVSDRQNPLTITDVVFSLGPRINAAGRLSHAKESVNLLIGAQSETPQFADNLNIKNKERQKYDKAITAEALEMIAEMPDDKKTTVLFNETWHKGIIGIVASRCIEHYYRPTIILTESNGKASGSARSVDGFDIHAAISACKDLLDKYGGHEYAAGLTLPLENLEDFQEQFEQVVVDRILPDQLIPKVIIDTELPLKHISFKNLRILSRMEPFGPQNLSPVFGTKNVYMTSGLQLLKEKHAKGLLQERGCDNKIEFIAFGLGDKMKHIQPHQPFDIAYHIDENNFMQRRSLIINIRDVKID